jgi:hypothetical protein
MKIDIEKYSEMGPSEALERLETFRNRLAAAPKRVFVDIGACEKDVILVGDLHGDIFSLARLLEAFPPGPDRMLVLLGDYIDRTPDEVEGGSLSLVLALADLTEEHPETVMLRGNHDIGDIMPCSPHEWPTELKRRLGGRWSQAANRWKDIAMCLPLVVRTWNGVLAAHGGFPRTLPFGQWNTFQMDDERLMLHTLWADPGECDSGRGLPPGTNFTREGLDKVLRDSGCGCFVRGHESSAIGATRWNEKVLTIMTAGYYAEQGRGSVLVGRCRAGKKVSSAGDILVLEFTDKIWEPFRPFALPDD